MHMVLAMSRPSRHPKTGIFWLRKRVPSDLVARVGRAIEYFSLQTREPVEAKQRHAEAVARLEARWAELRRGEPTDTSGAVGDTSPASRSLSEREAGQRAEWMYAHWLGLHRENPSLQRFWPTDLYRHLWRSLGGRIEHREDGRTTVRAVLTFGQAEKVAELEAWCQDQAETVLALHDIEVDEASTLRVAKAIAAQVQRASLTLAALPRGEPGVGPAPVATAAPGAKPAKAVGLIELVEAWWREAERTGKSESTRESYTNTIKQFVAFLKHDEAHRVIDPEIDLVQHNPARDVSYITTSSEGFHTWSIGEVLQFIERHPIGSKAYLALCLLLFAGGRRSDAVLFGRQHLQGAWIRYTQHKGRNLKPMTLEVPVLPALRAAIDACPNQNLTFLVTDYGKPFTSNGFGNWFKDRCRDASLPHCSAHGLRKAGAALAAENGATERQLMAMFGWRTAKMAEHYTRKADQKRLAGGAMHLIDLDREGLDAVPLFPVSRTGGTTRRKTAMKSKVISANGAQERIGPPTVYDQ